VEFLSLIRADVTGCAVPWARLILRSRNLPDDLNLKLDQRVSSGLVGLASILIVLSRLRIELLGFAAAALAGFSCSTAGYSSSYAASVASCSRPCAFRYTCADSATVMSGGPPGWVGAVSVTAMRSRLVGCLGPLMRVTDGRSPPPGARQPH
jgi:hypothetical protein